MSPVSKHIHMPRKLSTRPVRCLLQITECIVGAIPYAKQRYHHMSNVHKCTVRKLAARLHCTWFAIERLGCLALHSARRNATLVLKALENMATASRRSFTAVISGRWAVRLHISFRPVWQHRGTVWCLILLTCCIVLHVFWVRASRVYTRTWTGD